MLYPLGFTDMEQKRTGQYTKQNVEKRSGHFKPDKSGHYTKQMDILEETPDGKELLEKAEQRREENISLHKLPERHSQTTKQKEDALLSHKFHEAVIHKLPARYLQSSKESEGAAASTSYGGAANAKATGVAEGRKQQFGSENKFLSKFEDLSLAPAIHLK